MGGVIQLKTNKILWNDQGYTCLLLSLTLILFFSCKREDFSKDNTLLILNEVNMDFMSDEDKIHLSPFEEVKFIKELSDQSHLLVRAKNKEGIVSAIDTTFIQKEWKKEKRIKGISFYLPKRMKLEFTQNSYDDAVYGEEDYYHFQNEDYLIEINHYKKSMEEILIIENGNAPPRPSPITLQLNGSAALFFSGINYDDIPYILLYTSGKKSDSYKVTIMLIREREHDILYQKVAKKILLSLDFN